MEPSRANMGHGYAKIPRCLCNAIDLAESE